MKSRILKALSRASPENIAEGINWYPSANSFARSIFPDVKVAAGVIAVLSPRQHWDTNKEAARKLLKAKLNHSNIVPAVAGTYVSVGKAWRIAQGEDPEKVVLGASPKRNFKVPRFFRNILGDKDCVTIDTWAAKIADPNAPKCVRGKYYLQIEEAYQEASVNSGFFPSELQAIVWVAAHVENFVENLSSA